MYLWRYSSKSSRMTKKPHKLVLQLSTAKIVIFFPHINYFLNHLIQFRNVGVWSVRWASSAGACHTTRWCSDLYIMSVSFKPTVLLLFYINKYFYYTFLTDVESIVIRLILKIDLHFDLRIPTSQYFFPLFRSTSWSDCKCKYSI